MNTWFRNTVKSPVVRYASYFAICMSHVAALDPDRPGFYRRQRTRAFGSSGGECSISAFHVVYTR